ncbi:MAG: FtsK/SpoIIIE domain-containing protein [Anaerolineae bacterium]
MPEFFNRPPRIQPELPIGEVEIPSPPGNDQQAGQNLLQIGLPLITIAGYIMVSAAGGGRNPLFILPMAISMVASVSLGLWEFFKRRRTEGVKDRLYLERLTELRRDIEDTHDKQRIFYTFNFPEPSVCVQMAGVPSDPTPDPRLWERRVTDDDFGTLRIGMGTRPSSVVYKVQGAGSSDSPLIKEAMKLETDARTVKDIPITVSMRRTFADTQKGSTDEEKSLARHTIGIAGNDRVRVTDGLRSMLVNLTAMHAPSDMRLYVLGSTDSKRYWDWAAWLPHCNSSRNEISVGDQLGFEAPKRRRLWDDLQAELERRSLRLADNKSYAVTTPHIVVVIDGLSPRADDSPLKEAETEAALAIILRSGLDLGASVIFAVPDKNQVPSDCQAVIEISTTEKGETAFRYAETGVNTMRFDGVSDAIESRIAEQDFARRLAPLAVRSVGGADLANAVTLLEMNNARLVDDIPILKYWEESRMPERSDWLSVPVGLLIGNKVRDIVFSADGDGVHGMAAGTTGSGKSELLLTIITGLAIRYDPSIVNFVMVDFKGGAAFEPFRTLPHTVDIVTNLQGTAGARTFVALRSELNRRSKLIADSNTKHIVHYRSKGLHLTREPFPHLFVIIDEFAEMVKEMPEFKGHLDSIARLGRALGVHLLLATQRPSGVVSDQMRANMKFRICLRVETPEDSRELLRRSDAAFLPPNIPGRAYLQVGNENVELMQVARAGGPYTGPSVDTSPPVLWPKRAQKDQGASAKSNAEAKALSDVIVEITRNLADTHPEIEVQKKPWPDPLPMRLTLDAEYLGKEPNSLLPLNPTVGEWLHDRDSWDPINWVEDAMRTNIGLIDNPIRAEQLLLTLDFTKGHAVVFGASGYGKTSFIRTVVTGLAATHSPKDLNVYFMDFGGRGLDVLTDLPHVVASVLPSEEERVLRLLRRISNILEERRVLLSAARADNLLIYNTNNPDKALPAILVVIDNFAEFRENFENYIDGLIGLVRDGRTYGVHFLVSALLTNTLPGKLYNLFTERLTLRLADAGEYSNVVGRGVPDMGEIPGRGFVAVERSPLEFQTALAVGATAEDEGLDDTNKLSLLARRMQAAWKEGRVAPPIDILRPVIALRSVLPAKAPNKVNTILGLEDQNLEPALIDLATKGPHFVIIGPPLSGKTNALRTWTLSLASMYPPEKIAIILIDFQQRLFKYGGKHTLGALPQVYAEVSELKDLERVIADLKYEYETPRPADAPPRQEIFVLADNYDDFANVIGAPTSTKSTVYRDLSELGRKYGTQEGFHLVVGGSMSLMRGSDEFVKQALSSRYGLGLDSNDAPTALGGRARAGGTEFPPGRGYVVKSGRMQLIQVATPHTDGAMEDALDAWVEEIMAKYPQKVQLLKDILPPPEPPPAPATPAPAAAGAAGTAAATTAAAAGTPRTVAPSAGSVVVKPTTASTPASTTTAGSGTGTPTPTPPTVPTPSAPSVPTPSPAPTPAPSAPSVPTPTPPAVPTPTAPTTPTKPEPETK